MEVSRVTSQPNETIAAGAWLRVDTLAEFLRCARAGVLASERTWDDEPETPQSNLDFLPAYDLAAIERELNAGMNRLWRYSALALCAPMWTALLYVAGVHFLLVLLAAWFTALPAWLVFRQLCAVVTLALRRRQATRAGKCEPDETSTAFQPVNWWGLLKAGFDSVKYDELRDEALRLEGRPWRVLRRGSLRIPVVKARRLDAEGMLPIECIAKVAAFGRLLTVCDGGTVAYGVVLVGNAYDGVTVPFTAKSEQWIIDCLEQTREKLDLFGDPSVMPAPPPAAACAFCPLGSPPVPLSVGGQQTRHTSSPADGPLPRSRCGARFGWTPPHRRARALSDA
ncbi:MAG: hypothetical protein M3552_04240 [Planctomycetota bacterium]|nr:hypothetical protein [Planctomycetaceae bacterium]MDQ3329849.1 hypothetical protein [Planctomycetota bacterium]